MEIIAETVMALGLCVPKHATDEQIKIFADANHPSGTSAGWHRREGVCVPCEQDPNKIHIVMDF